MVLKITSVAFVAIILRWKSNCYSTCQCTKGMRMPKRLVGCASSAIKRLWIFIHTTLVVNITLKDHLQSLIAEMRAVPHSFLK